MVLYVALCTWKTGKSIVSLPEVETLVSQFLTVPVPLLNCSDSLDLTLFLNFALDLDFILVFCLFAFAVLGIEARAYA